MKHILVTGGAGFVGSHSVDALLAKGHEVTVIDDLSTGKRANLDRRHAKLTLIEDTILNQSLLKKLMSKVDAVLHLAAIASVPKSMKDPFGTWETNVLGMQHVFAAIHEAARPIRLVYASSASVYGDAKRIPCVERGGDFAEVLSPYAAHKIDNEGYASLYHRLFGVSSLGLRYFNIYGPRQDPLSLYSGVISHFMHAYAQDETLRLFGDGLQTRDFIHVSDVVRANLLALESDTQGVMNIATGVPSTLLALVDALKAAGGTQPKVSHEAPREGDIYASYADVSHAKTKLSFAATVSLQEGIKSLFQFFQDQVK